METEPTAHPCICSIATRVLVVTFRKTPKWPTVRLLTRHNRLSLQLTCVWSSVLFFPVFSACVVTVTMLKQKKMTTDDQTWNLNWSEVQKIPAITDYRHRCRERQQDENLVNYNFNVICSWGGGYRVSVSGGPRPCWWRQLQSGGNCSCGVRFWSWWTAASCQRGVSEAVCVRAERGRPQSFLHGSGSWRRASPGGW